MLVLCLALPDGFRKGRRRGRRTAAVYVRANGRRKNFPLRARGGGWQEPRRIPVHFVKPRVVECVIREGHIGGSGTGVPPVCSLAYRRDAGAM